MRPSFPTSIPRSTLKVMHITGFAYKVLFAHKVSASQAV